MNKLSWLIYFAGAAEAVFLVSAVGIAAIAVCGINAYIYNDVNGDYTGFVKKDPFAFKYLFILFTLAIIFVPGKKTILAISASEIGEAAVVQIKDSKYAKALDAWIDSQLKENGVSK